MALLRAEAGRNPHDRALSALIGELATRSEAFRQLWAAYDVRFHRTGLKHFRPPVIGELDLAFEGLDLTADGLGITAYTAEPGGPSYDALNLLASLGSDPRGLTRPRAAVRQRAACRWERSPESRSSRPVRSSWSTADNCVQ